MLSGASEPSRGPRAGGRVCMPPVAALTPLGSQPAVLGRGPSGPSKAALVEVTGDLYSEALSPSSRALRTNGPRLAHSSCRTVLPPDLSVPRPFGELLLGLLAGPSLALPPRFPRCPSPELRARPSSPVVLCPPFGHPTDTSDEMDAFRWYGRRLRHLKLSMSKE